MAREVDVEKVWEEFWVPIVVGEDGEVDMEQVKKELADYHTAIEQVGKAYDELTGGRITKPNTSWFHVVDAAEQEAEKIREAGE